jgi:uncharacterized protein YndB with AHSA1/START domain
MLIREEIDVHVPPERAWELISDPALHAKWNPHVVATENSGTLALGSRYRVTYELSGRRSEFDAEVTEFAAPTRFVARLEERDKGDGKNWQRFIEESYTLKRHGERTHIRHDANIQHSGINTFLRILIWLIMHMGKPQHPTVLERFRDLAEGHAEEQASRVAS